MFRISIGRSTGAAAALLILALAGGCATAPSAQPSETRPGTWQQYADPDGDSSVDAYQNGPDYIRVRFSDGSEYLYTYNSAGADDVERMKQLAQSGDGLNSYIVKNARYDYESKQR